jgi:hypothetical protein
MTAKTDGAKALATWSNQGIIGPRPKSRKRSSRATKPVISERDGGERAPDEPGTDPVAP